MVIKQYIITSAAAYNKSTTFWKHAGPQSRRKHEQHLPCSQSDSEKAKERSATPLADFTELSSLANGKRADK